MIDLDTRPEHDNLSEAQILADWGAAVTGRIAAALGMAWAVTAFLNWLGVL